MSHSPSPSPTPLLEYASISSRRSHALAEDILLAWQILCALATPPLMLIGVAGTYAVLTGYNWNHSSLEDWIGFLLWIASAPILIFVPPIWYARCGSCYKHLRANPPIGAHSAINLCTKSLRLASIITAGLIFGLLKALIHRRWTETPWWTGFLMALFIYTLAVLASRRVFLRAGANAPSPPSSLLRGPSCAS